MSGCRGLLEAGGMTGAGQDFQGSGTSERGCNGGYKSYVVKTIEPQHKVSPNVRYTMDFG